MLLAIKKSEKVQSSTPTSSHVQKFSTWRESEFRTRSDLTTIYTKIRFRWASSTRFRGTENVLQVSTAPSKSTRLLLWTNWNKNRQPNNIIRCNSRWWSPCKKSKIKMRIRQMPTPWMMNPQPLRWPTTNLRTVPPMKTGTRLLMYYGPSMMQISRAISTRKRLSHWLKLLSHRLASTRSLTRKFWPASSLRLTAMGMVKLTKMSYFASWKALCEIEKSL